MSTSTLRPVLRRTTPLLQTATRAFTTTPNRPLAKIQLIGRLAADPELHATSTGKDVLRYAIGTTHQTKDGPQTSWWRVACFDEGGRREYVQGLTKGTLVYVEGEARMNTYEDADRGKQSRLDLIQRNIEVISRPRTSTEASSGSSSYAASDDTASASG